MRRFAVAVPVICALFETVTVAEWYAQRPEVRVEHHPAGSVPRPLPSSAPLLGEHSLTWRNAYTTADHVTRSRLVGGSLVTITPNGDQYY